MRLRTSTAPLPLDAWLIRGGSGALEPALNAAVGYYDDYRGIRDDGLGYFAVSVFATVNGVEEGDIVRRLPHRTHGRVRVADVAPSYSVLPTADEDPNLPELQEVHFDVCLPDLVDPRLMTTSPLDDEDLLARCQAHVAPHLRALLALFEWVSNA